MRQFDIKIVIESLNKYPQELEFVWYAERCSLSYDKPRVLGRYIIDNIVYQRDGGETILDGEDYCMMTKRRKS